MKTAEIKTDQEKTLLLEQYRILTEVVGKITQNRETLNTFWTALNGTIIGAIAYLKDMQIDKVPPKTLFIWFALLFGFVMSMVWLQSILCIKKNIDYKNKLLMEMEVFLPAKIFTVDLTTSTDEKGNYSLSSTEISIPILFCMGYVVIAAILLIYPNIL